MKDNRRTFFNGRLNELANHAMDSASANVLMDNLVHRDYLASRAAIAAVKNSAKAAVTNTKSLVEATRG